MPPLPRLHIGAIQDLERQLRFAPPAALRKQIDRIEVLCTELAPDQTYPRDWLVFRITGYRTDSATPQRSATATNRRDSSSSAHAAELLVGSALLADLGVLIERLCDAAGIQDSELLGPPRDSELAASSAEWMDAEALTERWSISRKTLDRYRRLGLTARRVTDPSGRSRLLFRRSHVERFEQLHTHRLNTAAGFSRIEPHVEDKIVRLARKYHARLGWSLNQTAKRLAERFDRSHEAVRLLLKRTLTAPNSLGRTSGPPRAVEKSSELRSSSHSPTAEGRKQPCSVTPTSAFKGRRRTRPQIHGDQHAGTTDDLPSPPIFTEPGPLSPRQIRVIARAYAWGIDVDQLAVRFRKSRPTIYRVIHVCEADRLRSIDLSSIVEMDRVPTPATEKATLDHPVARLHLGPRVPDPPLRSLADYLAYAADYPVLDPTVERAAALAFHTLIHRARQSIASLSPHHPSAATIDRVQTDLRWATFLKIRLVLSQVPLVLKSLRVQLGGDLIELPRSAAQQLLTRAMNAVIEAIDRHDPSKGGRLAAPCGLAITRAASQWQRENATTSGATPSRAKRFTNPNDIIIDDWTSRVGMWQSLVDPSPRVWANLAKAPAPAQELLRQRFGWSAGLTEHSSKNVRNGGADRDGGRGGKGTWGEPPRTLIEVAADLHMTPHHAAALERKTFLALTRSR